jgi:hypothetical protein
VDYFLEIEGHFAARRGTPFILSAKDWALMKKWHEDQVPLTVVLEAIDQVFEKNETSGRRKVISSLSYCRHAVKELWEERKELYAGAGDASPEERPLELLEALAADVERASGPEAILRQAAGQIRALGERKTIPAIEEALIEMEHDLIAQLLEASPDAHAIRAEVAAAIAGVDEKARARTEEANLRRVVRERYELPRLTLFR